MRLAFMFLLAGCSTPGDNLRIVHPVTWHAVPAVELADVCGDWDERLRGCIIARPEGDHVYTLPVCGP